MIPVLALIAIVLAGLAVDWLVSDGVITLATGMGAVAVLALVLACGSAVSF